MKHILAAAVFILATLLATPAHAALPIRATLSSPHDQVLPGVPFDLVVTYTNVSDRPVTIGGALATLVVTFANGETVVMHKPEGHDQWNIGDPQRPPRLGPGESVQQAVSWERGSIPNWFRYGSYSGPGTYDVALELRIVDDAGKVLGNIRTPSFTLTRIEPVGIDAELWKRMQQVSEGRWSDNSFHATKAGNALAKEIIQLHPSSGYYPYVLALRALGREVDKNHIPALLEAAERFPSSPAHPYLLTAAAHCAWYAAIEAQRGGNPSDAKEYFTLAQNEYRAALATKSIAVRKSAEEGLVNVAGGMERLTKKPTR